MGILLRTSGFWFNITFFGNGYHGSESQDMAWPETYEKQTWHVVWLARMPVRPFEQVLIR